LVEAEAGGKRGGGAQLTRLGAEVIRRYRRIERDAVRAGATDLRALTRLVKG
jgi:molybdate transport system regulatory protein